MLELLAALLLMLFCIHLFFGFSQSYKRLLQHTRNLKSIGTAQLFLIENKQTNKTFVKLKTQKRICDANLLQNTDDLGVVYKYYEILQCK